MVRVMADCMTFPDTVEEFMEQYKIVDTEHVYTNGTEFVPIYRMKQWFEHLPPAQSETYNEKLKEIADALSEKFAYMNTCLNERDIILGYLGVKRPNEIHCNTDCTNIKCESYRCDKRLSPAQCNYKKMNTVYGLDGTVYTQDKDKQGWTGHLPPAQSQQKKGHWINAYPDIEPNPMFMYGICSVCGFEQAISNKLNFCPNCGADMRD